MYAQSIVDQRIGIASEDLGFPLEYRSVKEVQDFDRYLQEKYAWAYQTAESESIGNKEASKAFQLSLLRQLADPDNPRLTADEVRWMQNETNLVQCDVAYWLTRYYHIKTPSKIQLFTFLPGQRIYFDVVAELESRKAPIEMIINKARQHGISTLTEGFLCHAAAFTYGANCVIASADRAMTAKMSQMTLMGWDMMPWWMKPVYTRRVESQNGMLVFGSLKSGISFQHGNQMSAIARGDTIVKYHLSECASYTDPAALIEAGLFRCVHAHPSVFGVLESTAEGDTGWWYDTYKHARAKWKQGRSRLCPLFLPWFLATDKYPTDTWIRVNPVPRDYRPSPETRAMAARAKLYVQSNDVLEKVLGSGWKLPVEQMWYWEVFFEEHRAKGKEKLWFQEMPTDDHECFQGSYDNVFGREVIATAYSKRSREYEVFGITGTAIEEKHEPDTEEIDYDAERLRVRWRSHRDEIYQWELVPMQWTEPWEDLDDVAEYEGNMGKLFVWERPLHGFDYSIGVDTSSGIGSDNTVIAVARLGKHNEPDEQVAEFRSNLVSHVEAYAFVAAIAAWYGKPMAESEGLRFSQPYISVEQVAAVGDTCGLQLRKMGFHQFHKMIRYDSVKTKKSKATKQGWYTYGWSRPLLTDGFVVAVQNGWYIIHSPWTIWEMDHWEVHLTGTSKVKFEHQENATDDGIFANAMATFCPNDLKQLTERSKRRPTAMDFVKPTVDFGKWEGHIMPTRERYREQ